MPDENTYSRFYQMLSEFVRKEEILDEDWFIGDYVLVVGITSPLEKNRGLTGYIALHPDSQPPHATLGLLTRAANRMNHNMNQEMDEDE